ncbi:MAG: WD40/YVTN/BNR-like repeat-containing protein, partial [Bacteroidota bacterium]
MRATRWLSLCLLLIFGIGSGTLQTAAAQSAAWRPIGPSNLGGPVQSLAIDQSGTIWAASPNGGLFKSSDQGQSWEWVEGFNRLQDPSDATILTPSSIAIADNGNIYVGTGNVVFDRGLLGNFHTPLVDLGITAFTEEPGAYKGMIGGLGNGVYVSTDGGNTFSPTTSTLQHAFPSTNYDFESPWMSVQDMLAVGDRVFAATAEGVWYSDDNFQTVTQSTHNFSDPLTLDDAVLDLELGADNRIFATTGNSLYISDDNGASFTTQVSGLDFPRDEQDIYFDSYSALASLRMAVAVAPSDPNVVYVTEVSGTGLLWGVWKSTDNGDTWTRIGPRSSAFDKVDGVASQTFAPFTPAGFEDGIGDYALVLEVDANDPDHVYLAGDKWYEYTPDGGWKQNGTRNIYDFPADPKYVPRGAHSLVQNNDGSAFYLGTDGPIVRSTDDGNTFSQRTSGLQVAKMFDVAVALDGNIYGSSYPNGMVARLGSESTNWTIINRFRNPDISNLETSRLIPQQVILSTMNLGNGAGGGLQRSFDGLNSYEAFCATPDTAFGDFLTDSSWATGTADTCSAIQLPFDDHHQFSPFKMVEYVDPAGDSLVIDTLNNLLAERWVFSANAFGVYATQRPFWTAADEGEQTYTTRLTPNFSEEDFGVPTAIDVTEDGTYTVYVGTNSGRIFRITRADDPRHPDFSFAELTPDTEEFTEFARSISAIAINPFDKSQVVIAFGSYFNREFFGQDFEQISNIHLITDAESANPTFESIQGDMVHPPIHDLHFNQLYDVNPNWLFAVGTEFGLFTTSELTP